MTGQRLRHIATRPAWPAAVLALTVLGAPILLGAARGSFERGDLDVVDCLLPGQVRRLGMSTYQTPRRPAKTTASDCRIRGGEYVAYDRANLKTALAVWLEAAEAGDAQAQNNVGEIYERGLGVEPNYEAAALWYQKAADQRNSRALFNLGTLYEQGLGVPADKLRALNLYRQSWGLPEDSVIFQSAASEEIGALRTELEQTITEKDEQLAALQAQIGQLQQQIQTQRSTASQAGGDVGALNRQVESLKKLVESLEGDRSRSSQRLAALRTPVASGAAAGAVVNSMKPAEARKALGINFGRYYALVIGNQHYQAIDNLQTPISDAQRAASVLKDRYGFSVKVLEDADDASMMKALNDLHGTLKEDDNLLIYYAGHGMRLQTGARQSGYWLGVNAAKPPDETFWVQNERITAHLARLPARRVLVVADSCYAGLLSDDPGYRFMAGKAGPTLDYVKSKAPRRSRLLLASGGDRPVLDTGGGKNSVFARAFIDELEANNGVLSVPELFARLVTRVKDLAARNDFVQTPEFKAIKGAGHEMGDFYFVPKT